MDMDKIIADLIKGAERAGAKVELKEKEGHEEKLAYDLNQLKSILPLLEAAGIAAAPGAITGAITGGEGHRLSGAGLGAVGGLGGAALGGLGGMYTGDAIQRMRGLRGMTGAMQGLGAGTLAGSALGGGLAGRLVHDQEEGAKAACDHFHIKHAFLGALAPMLGAVAGPALARGALGKLAPRMTQGLGQGFKGQAFDMAGSMGGQMLGSHLGGQQG